MRLRGFRRASVARVSARDKCNNAGQQHSARASTTTIMLFIAPHAYCVHVGRMVVCHLQPACPQLAFCKLQKGVGMNASKHRMDEQPRSYAGAHTHGSARAHTHTPRHGHTRRRATTQSMRTAAELSQARCPDGAPTVPRRCPDRCPDGVPI